MKSVSRTVPWTVAHQAPLTMEFSRQEYWSGWHSLPSPGIFRPRDGTRAGSPARLVDSLLSEPPGFHRAFVKTEELKPQSVRSTSFTDEETKAQHSGQHSSKCRLWIPESSTSLCLSSSSQPCLRGGHSDTAPHLANYPEVKDRDTPTYLPVLSGTRRESYSVFRRSGRPTTLECTRQMAYPSNGRHQVHMTKGGHPLPLAVWGSEEVPGLFGPCEKGGGLFLARNK